MFEADPDVIRGINLGYVWFSKNLRKRKKRRKGNERKNEGKLKID